MLAATVVRKVGLHHLCTLSDFRLWDAERDVQRKLPVLVLGKLVVLHTLLVVRAIPSQRTLEHPKLTRPEEGIGRGALHLSELFFTEPQGPLTVTDEVHRLLLEVNPSQTVRAIGVIHELFDRMIDEVLRDFLAVTLALRNSLSADMRHRPVVHQDNVLDAVRVDVIERAAAFRRLTSMAEQCRPITFRDVVEVL